MKKLSSNKLYFIRCLHKNQYGGRYEIILTEKGLRHFHLNFVFFILGYIDLNRRGDYWLSSRKEEIYGPFSSKEEAVETFLAICEMEKSNASFRS